MDEESIVIRKSIEGACCKRRIQRIETGKSSSDGNDQNVCNEQVQCNPYEVSCDKMNQLTELIRNPKHETTIKVAWVYPSAQDINQV